MLEARDQPDDGGGAGDGGQPLREQEESERAYFRFAEDVET